MSYILEALKRLEQRRRSSVTSPLLTASDRPHSAARRPVLQYLLLAALIVNASLFLWWLHPWNSLKTSESVPGLEAAAVRADDGPNKTKEVTRADETESGGSQSAGLNQTEDTLPPAKEAPRDEASSQLSPRPSNDPPSEKKVVVMGELPASVSQRLPDLTISGHFYGSRPSSRVVTIGGRMLHEGAVAAPGVTLEEITPDGAVFSFEGYRFRKGIF